MHWSDAVWAGLIVAAGGFEAWAAIKKPEATLSQLIKRVFRVSTTAGRGTFLVLLLAATGLLAWHIAG